MTRDRETLIKKTLTALSRLPQDKVSEISDFADFVLKKYDEEILQKGIETLVSESKIYEFLKEEEDLYTLEDL
nr:hypothetical protein [Bacteroidota bacterium]